MKFGTFQLQSVPPWSNCYDVAQQHFEQMVEADTLGFHELWLAEHNARRYGMMGNVITLAAAIAAATKRIRIATAVSRIPLHHPLHLAEDLAYVDILSGGRLDWGVGKGYDALEFSTYGIDFETREERWNETLNAVRQIWETRRTKFDGKFYKLGDAELWPLPLQRPQLPTYIMVSGSERSLAWAAEHLLPVAMGTGPTPDQLRDRLNLYADTANAAGYSDDQISQVLANTWQLKPMHVSTTTERAIAEYRGGLEWYMGEKGNRAMFGFSEDKRPYDYYVQHRSVMIGSAEKIAEDLADYQRLSGVNNVICWFNMGGAASSASTSGAPLIFL